MEPNTQPPLEHIHMSSPPSSIHPKPNPPSPKPKVGATDFFLHFGFIAAFYTFVGTLVSFTFSIINTLFPDRQYNYYDPYASGMRVSVSILIVVTPLVLFLLKKIYQHIRQDPAKKDLWVRRWGLYLTLTLSIIALAIDLAVLINTFLGGEITTRFTLKAVTVIIIGLLVWWFTRREINNSLAHSPKGSKGMIWGVAGATLIMIIVGISYIGSPMLLRNIRDDNERESDLRSLNYQVLAYYQSKNAKLPATLNDITLGDPYASPLPIDPATEQPYEYKILPDTVVNGVNFPTFSLCATFSEDGEADKRAQNAGGSRGGMTDPIIGKDMGTSYPGYPYSEEGKFAKHPKGYACFEQSIDPVRYKPWNPDPAAMR